jgi:hypothetical protein
MRIPPGSSCCERCTSISGSLRSRLYLIFATLLFASVASPARAGWEEGYAAYERGHYDAAFAELLPLALAGIRGHSSASARCMMTAMVSDRITLKQPHGTGVPLSEA